MKNHPKLQLLMVYLGLVMLFMTIAQPGFSQSVHDETKSQKINNALNEVTNSNKAPGMIGAIISSEGIIAISSAGVRKAGSDIPFAISDHVHLGSCGKAMTSAMLATLVAEGKLSWETRFIEVLPELKSKIHSDYHDVTIWELLTHRSGAPSWWTLSQRYTKEKRLELLLDKLKAPAPKKRGEFHYSNLGYVMAGYMAEKITGGKWETLMQGRVFNPLGMTSAGFGFPGTKVKLNNHGGMEDLVTGGMPARRIVPKP